MPRWRCESFCKPELKMPKDHLLDMFKGAEVFRSCAHLMTLFAKPESTHYGKANLRTDIIAELKSLRSKINSKEQDTLPTFIYDQVQKVLWDR